MVDGHESVTARTRKFTVVRVEGHTDVTHFGSVGPEFVEVMVSLRNAMDETAELRVPIVEQPRVGDIMEVPTFAVWSATQ